MVTAEWNEQKWKVSKNVIRGIESITMSVGARTETDKESKEVRCIGRTLETLEVTFSTTALTGGDPKGEQKELHNLCGTSSPFYCGEEQLGENDFILTEVSMTEGKLTPKGDIVSAKFDLTFLEDSRNQEQEGVKSHVPNIKIMYEGKDIFPSISVYEIHYTQYSENHADVLEMQFNDIGTNWDRWDDGKMKGTEISVEAEGIKTGKMYVFNCEPKNNRFHLKAMSVPPDYNSTATKAWEGVTLEDLAKEVAGNHGLDFKSFDTKGKKRKHVHQDNEGDFKFLSRRCELEGACFVVYDGILNLYDEMKIENGQGGVEIDIDDEKFTSIAPSEKTNLAVGEYTISNGRYEGTATDEQYKLVKTLVVSEAVESSADCEELAKAYLRKENKGVNTIEIKTDLLKGVSAGSVVKCKSAKKPKWNAELFVYKLRHSIVENKTTVWARKPLSY